MKKIFLACILITILLASVTYYVIAARIEYNQNELLHDAQASDLYQMYVSQEPMLEQRHYVGENNAHITFIAAIDFTSDQSKTFYETILLPVYTSHVQTGQAKLYHKYYLTREEYDQKKGRFIYATASQCYEQSGKTDVTGFNKQLFDTPESQVAALLEEKGVDATQCAAQLYEDMIESEMFRIISPALYVGIDGSDNTILYGLPSQNELQKTIRFKQIQLGI